MSKYDIRFLESKGFFKEKYEIEEEYEVGKSVRYVFDPIKKIAYFDNFNKEDITNIVKGLKKRRNFDYYWFWEENRVCCFRTFGENKRFIFNLDHSLGHEWIKGKIKKLEDFSSSNPNVLFEVKEVIDYFYKRLWDLRIELASCIQDEINDNEKVMCAQRLIDRLIFTYFLAEKGIIYGIDNKGNKANIDARKLFEFLVNVSQDFYTTLNRIFFEYLSGIKKNDMPIEGTDGFSLYIPYLNGGLFREKKIKGKNGEIKESALTIEGFDWSKLIRELNNYNWIIEEYSTSEKEDAIGNLTPDVLGHIYEKFVISVSELKDVKIEQLKVTQKGELKKGNKKIGAFYTPEDVTSYICENTIFPYVKERLGLDSKNFEDFYATYKDDTKKLHEFENVLANIKIVDPSVGSGHFLMTAAELIADWRKKCGCKMSDYQLRKDIIINNLFGVDIMEGAVEICKLRLWLWLVAAQKPEKKPEPLPNIDFNIRVGNSLFGFAQDELYIKDQKLSFTENLKTDLQEYKELIEQYKREHKDADKQKEKINELHSRMQKRFNEWYNIYLNNNLNSKLYTEKVYSTEEIITILEQCKNTLNFINLKLSFTNTISDDLKYKLRQLGYTVYNRSANIKLETSIYKYKKSIINQILVPCKEADEIVIERYFIPADLKHIKVFHWILEFPAAYMNQEKKGFDVVIGNPPYGTDVLSSKEKFLLSFRESDGCQDICGYFLDREIELTKCEGYVGNVIAGSLVVNDSMSNVRDIMTKRGKFKLAFFGIRPAKIFDSVDERVCIVLGKVDNKGGPIYTARNIRFTKEMRETLFENIKYASTEGLLLGSGIGIRQNNEGYRLPKIGDEQAREILLKLKSISMTSNVIANLEKKRGSSYLEIRTSARYWINALKEFPYKNTKIKKLRFENDLIRNFVLLVLNSSLFYFYWSVYGNNRDVFMDLVKAFPLPKESIFQNKEQEIAQLSDKINNCLLDSFCPEKGTNGEFNTGQCKSIILEIDDFICKLYGLSEEQTTFIKMYDDHLRRGAGQTDGDED
ncbi:Eco57I restriction-modification methylase domain-containing protein [Calderihabitans maritimus]|uniref:site-specific DNA-methyltransferase (adenine-specific) n=1 Tax=Calderihabitans maritimus TaxID=1246530 RepID=A0A1Z5HR65_9FIRM|nr:DNA methyltransferase [Calderihabitans maritimus]GAW91811.1 hypothetical protein Mbur_2163 [Calderihabitans maritimus]